MKKLNNKGFTLIEIVIVIVIIAILAAMLVPSLTQWIQKSKIKTFTSACGEVRTAVAAQLSERYANGKTNVIADMDGSDYALISKDLGDQTVGTATVNSGAKYIIDGTNTDSGFSVKDTNFKGTWDGSTWTVTKADGSALD